MDLTTGDAPSSLCCFSSTSVVQNTAAPNLKEQLQHDHHVQDYLDLDDEQQGEDLEEEGEYHPDELEQRNVEEDEDGPWAPSARNRR